MATSGSAIAGSAQQQEEQALAKLNAIPDSIEKYMWLRKLQEDQPGAYYRCTLC